MDNFFSKNFIQINGRYINKNHIVLVKEYPEDGEVYIALSNREQLHMGGTLDQLIEKMCAYDTFELDEENEIRKMFRRVLNDALPDDFKMKEEPTKPERTVVDVQEQYDIMRQCTVKRIKYSDGTYEFEDVD